jgi:hypothetical protein
LLEKYNFLVIMLGSIIGGALKIGGSIFGGISASKAMKKVKQNIENQQRENEDWYNRRYGEDGTQRADAQRVLTATNEAIRQRNQQAAAAQAVSGGTEESVAATKAANAQAMADAASRIAVNADRRKDNIENSYLQNKSTLNDQLNNLEQNRATAISQAVQGVSSAGSGLGSLLDEIGKTKQEA